MTDTFRREMAPISDEAWKEIELQSSRVLKGNLSGRRLVDFNGPLGWQFASVNLGQLNVGAGDVVDGMTWGIRKVLPLMEIRVPFSLGIWELDDINRGSKTPDLDALKKAAKKVAIFEEKAIYRGFSAAAIQGMLEGSPHPPVVLSADRGKFSESVELALLAIQEAQIGGPFALVLGSEPYKWLMAGDPNAYPLRERIQTLVLGGVHWSPILKGGAVISCRGGDFEITVGQDMTIGYKMHSAQDVELYFAESFTFRVLEPAAAVELILQTSS